MVHGGDNPSSNEVVCCSACIHAMSFVMACSNAMEVRRTIPEHYCCWVCVRKCDTWDNNWFCLRFDYCLLQGHHPSFCRVGLRVFCSRAASHGRCFSINAQCFRFSTNIVVVVVVCKYASSRQASRGNSFRRLCAGRMWDPMRALAE